ncbi:hypothetical protein GCM10009551_050510 [Nocardiopsis tropica]
MTGRGRERLPDAGHLVAGTDPHDRILSHDPWAGGYVAQAVGVGVASQGETEQEASAALTEALELYFEDDGPTG